MTGMASALIAPWYHWPREPVVHASVNEIVCCLSISPVARLPEVANDDPQVGLLVEAAVTLDLALNVQ